MTHREWNPKSFFRHLTPDVLVELHRWADVDAPLDGHGPMHAQMYRAWQALPPYEQQRLEASLTHANDMCSPHARPYLERVADELWSGSNRLPELSRSWTAHDLAVLVFLEGGGRFERAYESYALDRMAHLHEYRGRYAFRLEPSAEAKAGLREAMVRHLRETALGARCQVEDFANDEKFAVYVFHEDELTPLDRFNHEGVVEPDWQRPVIRLAAIFHFETQVLLVKAPRAAERERLRDLFAEVFVGDRDYFEDESTHPRFCFEALRDPRFEFPTRGGDGIEGVSLVKVTARSWNPSVRSVTVDLGARLTLAAARELLLEHGVALGTDELTAVQLQFRFEGKGRASQRTVSLKNPNSSNLCDTRRDRLIRRYLKEWGIDASGSRPAVEPLLLEDAAE